MDFLAKIFGRQIFLHEFGHQMTPVGRSVDQQILRGGRDRTIQDRLQCLVAGFFGVKRQIVAEQDKFEGRLGHQIDDVGQIEKLVFFDFDQSQVRAAHTG